MNQINSGEIILQKSKSGHLVPVINGKQLHSLNNPIREAEVWASNYIGTAKNKNHFLIMGLGFGYHILEFQKIAQLRQKKAHILVLETNAELISHFKTFNEGFESIQIEHLQHTNFIENKNILKFLAQGPAILAYMPSFESNLKTYQNFLSSKATQDKIFYQKWAETLNKNSFENLKQVFMTNMDPSNERKHVNRQFI